MTRGCGNDAAATSLTVADVRAEFAPHGWQFQEGRFCWSAIRRPTSTAVEVLTGHDLSHLAVKLRAEMDGTQQ